ncbi:FadR family transcriptional regulator [Actinomyces sp. B33]|uniref:FadR/GntR family transcriptional regulator n=1 Tax=Actinomyces sp. B33 TaxID=2942131 RepID=UPI0023427785|nr:FadR/GntR family transcriptional regulator [Actinomyces sp. B33]MDC4233791.1 FadR family transcriptional regulator [Actinomyces sp. B33]
MRKDLVEQVVDALLDGIAEGRYRVGEALPGEVDLAADLEVSRLTVREAVKVLRERGVLRVVHGRGTYLAPREEWTDLGTVVSMSLRKSSPREVGLRLTELRRMIEVGASGLAALNRRDEDVAALAGLLEVMDRAGAEDDVRTVVAADIAFHDRIMRASRNPYIGVVMSPLERALRSSRVVTASNPRVRDRAQEHHRAIFEAIRDGDEQAAKDAMRSHMSQTRRDLIESTAR